MKALHRAKALDAYEGARLVLKQGMSYPAYMLLKEAARGVLSYIAEDLMNRDISEKTKLAHLLEFMPDSILTIDQHNSIAKLIDAENKGLEAIISMDIDELRFIKHNIKELIAKTLKEPV